MPPRLHPLQACVHAHCRQPEFLECMTQHLASASEFVEDLSLLLRSSVQDFCTLLPIRCRFVYALRGPTSVAEGHLFDARQYAGTSVHARGV